MPCSYDHVNSTLEPGQDFNVQTPAAQATGTANPPIPESERPATPEFLQELIRELDALRQRDSENWADMYPAVKPGQVPKVPPYEQKLQYERESEEIQKKIAALRARIYSMRVLLAAKPPTEPELEKTKGPAFPADAVTAPEVQKGPPFPVQKPSEPFTPVEVPHSHTVPGRQGGMLRPAHPGEQPPRG